MKDHTSSAEKLKRNDLEMKRLIEARNYAANIIYEVRKKLNGGSDQLTGNAQVDNLMMELMQAVDGGCNDPQLIRSMAKDNLSGNLKVDCALSSGIAEQRQTGNREHQ